MKNVAGMALGVGTGSVVSSTLMSAMSPGEKQAAVAEATTNVPKGCDFQLETFNKCLDKAGDPEKCQWIYEDLMSCKNSNANQY